MIWLKTKRNRSTCKPRYGWIAVMPRVPFSVTQSTALHHCFTRVSSCSSALSFTHTLFLCYFRCVCVFFSISIFVHAVIVSNTILPMGIQASDLQCVRVSAFVRLRFCTRTPSTKIGEKKEAKRSEEECCFSKCLYWSLVEKHRHAREFPWFFRLYSFCLFYFISCLYFSLVFISFSYQKQNIVLSSASFSIYFYTFLQGFLISIALQSSRQYENVLWFLHETFLLLWILCL